ncbi:MAG: glycine--tRNA ligase [bacterium]|nr:glycine--tRNA ligase [bacterium]
MENKLEKIVSLAKRRGFVYQSSEIYGGLAGVWDYGPLGVLLKNNIKNSWWKKFVLNREDVFGLDAAILMNPKVWEASGHAAGFSDPLVECKKCHKRFRADKIKEENKFGDGKCPECGGELTEEKQFNMMFKTFIGAVEGTASRIYLRPETAQGIFVNFKNVVDSMHPKLPFGIAQIGKSFRNEITPGDFLFRVREFEQMEVEYFIKPPKNDEEWQTVFEHWRSEIHSWLESIGIAAENLSDFEVPKDDLAHYSKRTIDVFYKYPFGDDEVVGLAYRTDFDLKNHKLDYYDEESKERFVPHTIEPSFGVDRPLLAVLCEAYTEDEMSGETRVFLKFKPEIAPIKAAVFPLLKNKPELVAKAREVYEMIKKEIQPVVFDDNGNIGKRYRRQDEIGTPYCVTVDFDTLEDNTVTLRDRDTGEQERVKIEELISRLKI